MTTISCVYQEKWSSSEYNILVVFLSFINHLFSIFCALVWGISDSLAGKESTCNVGNWVRSLGWKDSLEEGMATHSSILAWRIPMDRGAWWARVHGVTKSWTRLSD